MKQNWEYKKLGDVCVQICDGSHAPPQGIEFSDYPMLSSKNIFFDSLNYDEPRFLTKDDFDAENKRTNISDGDVLLTIVGTVGRSCVVVEPFKKFVLQRSVAVLKPKKTLLISRFLMYKMTSLSSYFEREARGVAQKGIYLKQLSQLPIPVPPLSEQKRIVEELDLLTGIIDKQKAQLKELDTLAQSIFYDMFGDPIENEKGWTVELLKHHTTKIGSGATPKGGNESYKSEGIPLIRSLNVYNGCFRYKDLAYIDDVQAAALDNVVLQQDDVLLNITGASVARCCIVPNELVSGRVNQHVSILRPKEHLKSVFLCAQLISDEYQRKLLHDSKSNGATREALTKSQLENLPFILPPLPLQQSFANKIQSIENQKAKINQSIAETQKLLDYTMDKYFG